MNLHSTAKVIYETQILENGRVIKRNAPKRNLLLDSGLDSWGARSFWDSFAYCVLGTGTTPTKRDSGAITVTIASEVATASAGFFEAGDVGRLLKLDSGQEVYIDGFTSSTEVSVTGASDDAASEATVWYVNETGHGNEVVRTNNLGSDSGDVASTWDGSTIEHKRTFIFPTESSSLTYKEIGWSHIGSSGGNLLGRDLIPGGGDSISAGQQYKVVVKLQITTSLGTPQSLSDVGTGGFNTAGDILLYSIRDAFEGASSPFKTDGTGLLELWTLGSIFLCLSDFTLPGTTGNGYSNPPAGHVSGGKTIDAYVSGSWERVVRHTFGTGSGNGTVYGLGFGLSGFSTPILLKFDTPQTKDSDHTLEIALKQSWGRTLTN